MFLVEGGDFLRLGVFEDAKSTFVEIRAEIIPLVYYDRVKDNFLHFLPKNELSIVTRLAVLRA